MNESKQQMNKYVDLYIAVYHIQFCIIILYQIKFQSQFQWT